VDESNERNRRRTSVNRDEVGATGQFGNIKHSKNKESDAVGA